ncbi:MAG: hypothetical protein PUE99_07040 [Anaerovibrio sp.]|nr:hypothetical protein [Anaerovibrio sp.]
MAAVLFVLLYCLLPVLYLVFDRQGVGLPGGRRLFFMLIGADMKIFFKKSVDKPEKKV